MYSITAILHHHTDKHSLRKIVFQVIVNRRKIYHPTIFKVLKGQFDGKVINHPLAVKINQQLNLKRIEIESKLIAVGEQSINTAKLKELVTGIKKDTGLFSDFVEQLREDLKGKFSEARLRRYKSIGNKMDLVYPGIKLYEINLTTLQKFEAYLAKEKLDTNTINNEMKALKTILNKAAAKGLYNYKQVADYKPPKYIQKIPDYLTEDEMAAFEDVVKAARQPAHVLAGYYFLLGCFTGYRISDLKRFDYNKQVRASKIILRAKKNGEIVSILIYPMLARTLEYCKDHPLDISEPKTREYVKEIAMLAGLARKVKVHTARHSFAMMLINRGFSVDEVATLLGDSKEVARIYARITNVIIDKKVRDLMN